MVANMAPMVGQGTILHDSIGLRFSELKWK
jgi:hypothetical protein